MSDMNLPPIGGSPAQENKAKPAAPETTRMPAKCECDDKDCKDKGCKTMPASSGTAGRSQVGNADNISNDVKFAIDNPELMQTCDKYFEEVMADLEAQGTPDAYEQACTLTQAFAKELKSA